MSQPSAAPSVGRVVTFGEAMIRLSPPRNERLERTTSLDVTMGGAELNVAVTLAALGVPATWVSVLPNTSLGRGIARQARAHGVDTSRIHWVDESAGRTGLYFLEEAADPRPSAVLYDRANSAMARMHSGVFDWEQLLHGASAFLVSGITPALGPGTRAETFASMQVARRLGIPVFFDPNYRSKLWSEDDARACYQELAPYIDVLFASKGALETFYGVVAEDSNDAMIKGLAALDLKAISFTRKKGKKSRSMRLCSYGLLPGGEIVDAGWREIEVVDRVGGGDAFAGGFIAGWVENQHDVLRAVQLGAAAAALKHTMPGDFLCATRAEVEAAIDTSEGGVLQR